MLSSGRMESGGEHWSLKEQLIAVIGLVLAFGFVLRKAIFGGLGSPVQEAFVTIAAQWITLAVIAFIAFRALKLRAIDMGLRAVGGGEERLIPLSVS